jgi:hypothetical protein
MKRQNRWPNPAKKINDITGRTEHVGGWPP